MGGRRDDGTGHRESYVKSVIAVVFLLVGYQTALFVHRASVVKIAADRDNPDTVLVYYGVTDSALTEIDDDNVQMQKPVRTERISASHSPVVQKVREHLPPPQPELFHFDPNNITKDDLCRLGFTAKQAQSICNYRSKGGRFHRKEDFAESYVVSDDMFNRLAPYISIPKIDINLADSAGFDALPGIGGWFASKIISHRDALGGFSHITQLLDIYRFDQEKLDAISDLVYVSKETVTPYPLWTLPADSLYKHPYISNKEVARSIVLYRENTHKSQWTINDLRSNGILSDEQAEKLSLCVIAPPES